MNLASIDAHENYERVFQSACAAGARAAAAVTTPLMIVTDPDRLRQTAARGEVGGIYFEPEGPCGYAMAVIHPATYRFPRWLLKQGYAHRLFDRPGIYVPDSCNSQSIHRAAAYMLEFAYVIGRSGFCVDVEVVLRYD